MTVDFSAVKSRHQSSHIAASAAIASKAFSHLLTVAFLCFTGAVLLGSDRANSANLPDFKRLVEEKGAAVVKVTVTAKAGSKDTFNSLPNFNEDEMSEFYKRFFDELPEQPGGGPSRRPDAGFGSGFVVSDDGYIVTNAHVVNNAAQIVVSLPDGRQFDARLVGVDKRTDLAVLDVDASDLPVLQLGDSKQLKVGQWVLAIGSPFGFEYTATQGIVSALARSLPNDSYVPFIQTDVAVNPGNSGGPLFDLDGNVIGVNSQIFSGTGGYMGLSFAIPANMVRSVTSQLLDKGYVSRGWLGVTIQDVNQSLADSFGLNTPAGALVSSVIDGGPAKLGGIRAGDVILAVNGEPVSLSADLPPMIGSAPIDEHVQVELLRDRRRITLNVVIQELAEQRDTDQSSPLTNRALGLVAAGVPVELQQQLGIEGGVMVKSVDKSGVAAAAGIIEGDVITTFGKDSVTTPSQLARLVTDAEQGQSIAVLIYRAGKSLFVALTMP